MRSHRTLLISLALNLALIGGWFALRERGPKLPELAGSEGIARSNEIALLPSVIPAVTISNPPPIPFRWPMLETNDARVYVANLREVDCPEHVLRELLVAKVENQYRLKARAEPVNYEPWVGRDRRDVDRRTERGRVADLRREQFALVRELLGYDWNSEVSREWSREEMAGIFLGFLSDLKAQQVMAQVMASVQGLEDQFSFFESRIIIDEDLEQFARFRSGLGQELSRVLAPQELDELETRAQLGLLFTRQFYLDGMDASGAELRAIMQASRGYRDVLTTILLERGMRNEERSDDGKRREFESALVTSLGATRFADFQRSQEKAFRDAFEFTKQQELPRAVAVSLYEAQRTAESQRREITSDTGLSADQRKLALEVLQTATAAAVATTLGKQFTNYFNGNGRWLKQLSSASTAKTAPRDYRR